jgi:cytochrome c1
MLTEVFDFMTKQDYAKERKDPRWQKMRLRILERDGFACVHCGAKDKTLSVHHSYYVKGRKCWQYPMFSLRSVCDSCHDEQHSYTPELEDDESWSPLEEWEQVAELIFVMPMTQCGVVWYAACEIRQAFSRGASVKEIFRAIEVSVMALRKAKEISG